MDGPIWKNIGMTVDIAKQKKIPPTLTKSLRMWALDRL